MNRSRRKVYDIRNPLVVGRFINPAVILDVDIKGTAEVTLRDDVTGLVANETLSAMELLFLAEAAIQYSDLFKILAMSPELCAEIYEELDEFKEHDDEEVVQ
jgi:hypothetical protein